MIDDIGKKLCKEKKFFEFANYLLFKFFIEKSISDVDLYRAYNEFWLIYLKEIPVFILSKLATLYDCNLFLIDIYEEIVNEINNKLGK